MSVIWSWFSFPDLYPSYSVLNELSQNVLQGKKSEFGGRLKEALKVATLSTRCYRLAVSVMQNAVIREGGNVEHQMLQTGSECHAKCRHPWSRSNWAPDATDWQWVPCKMPPSVKVATLSTRCYRQAVSVMQNAAIRKGGHVEHQMLQTGSECHGKCRHPWPESQCKSVQVSSRGDRYTCVCFIL